MKIRRRPVGKIEDRMLKAAAEFLKSKGWGVVVISAARIQGPVSAGFTPPIPVTANYEFVLRFTGKKAPEPRKRTTTQFSVIQQAAREMGAKGGRIGGKRRL